MTTTNNDFTNCPAGFHAIKVADLKVGMVIMDSDGYELTVTNLSRGIFNQRSTLIDHKSNRPMTKHDALTMNWSCLPNDADVFIKGEP